MHLLRDLAAFAGASENLGYGGPAQRAVVSQETREREKPQQRP